MPDRLSEIEARLARVEDAVRVLSRSTPLPPGLPEPDQFASAAAAFLPARLDATTLLTLTGRTLIVLGGAYALRAVTDSGHLSAGAGVLIGGLYALVWLGVADRIALGQPSARLSGSFHGAAAVLIGFPLIWETAMRFQLVSAAVGAAGLAMLSLLALLVAAHRRLPVLAGLVVAASVAASAGLIVRTGQPLPFAAGLLAVGAITFWFAGAWSWWWLCWLPALAIDLLMIAIAARASTSTPIDSPWGAIALELIFVAVYVSATVRRTLRASTPLHAFDMIQTAASIAIGLGGASVIARASLGPVAAGVAGLTLALACGAYAVAFGAAVGRDRSGRAFVFYAMAALVLTMAGVSVAITGTARVVAFGALTAVTLTLGARLTQPMLSLHGAVFNLSAAISSGLLAVAAMVWTVPSGWPALSGAGILALAITLAATAAHPLDRRARVILLATAVVSVAGVLVHAAGGALGPAPSPGAVAALRTAVLAAGALLLAAIGRSPQCREFRWFVYPVLIAGGLKLAVDDFRHSTAIPLFLALAAYGAALVLAPRLLSKSLKRGQISN